MKDSEHNSIVKWAASKSDTELEEEYYNAVSDSLGSLTNEMYEHGYDTADIIEREKYEKFLLQRVKLLEELCIKRGIKLWEELRTDNEKEEQV